MTLFDTLKTHFQNHWVTIGFVASAVITWPVLAEFELFEMFYEYSRTHEDWDLDEIALLIINLTIALMLSSFFQSKRLKKVIAERDTQYQITEKISRHDALTGLMNRRAFADVLATLDETADRSKTRIIAMVDLDRFKPINDLFGHAAGDAALQMTATRLKTELGPGAIVARLGGDEFAFVLEHSLDDSHGERVARRLLHSMETAVDFEDRHFFLQCSVGLAKVEDDLPYSEAMRRANKALYTAKHAGRGQFAWYDEELDRQSQQRAEIEADLKKAISQSEIVPWFQPIVEIQSKQLVGFEVLARWNHKTRGNVTPDVFIGIAEDSGNIGALGMSILQQACLAARDWDPKLTISFNISPSQFNEPKLVEQIKHIVEECDFDPTRLTIEVTESSVIYDFDVARKRLEDLKRIGVAVALDDFGTGYSSLASLRQLPFDRIKIDRSFVTNISQTPQNQKIVTGIMALANGLDLEVTAEGIETEADLAYLGSSACNLGQGFFFEKALDAEQISWLLGTQWSNGKIQPNQTPQQDVAKKAG